ncbi:MAG TPA: hypothetical protein VJA21_14360 [Verrucomicrobiae bacterium]
MFSADPRGNPNRVTVVYSEPMEAASAGAAANYRLANAVGTAVAISSATLAADQTNVFLDLGETLQLTTNYFLTISDVRSLGLVTIAPSPTVVNFWYGGNPNGATFSFDDGQVPAGTRLAVGPDSAGRQVNPSQGVTNAGGFGNSGCLVLGNPASGETFGQWRLMTDYSGGVTVTNLQLAFKLLLGNGTGGNLGGLGVPNSGGNGMVFHWGPGLLEQYSGGASSFGYGLDVTFRTYNSAPNTPGVNIYYGGTAGAGNNAPIATSTNISYFATNGPATPDTFEEAVDVNLSISNGVLNLAYSNAVLGNVVCYSNYAIPGFTPQPMGGNYVAFTTTDGGGAHESCWLDDVDMNVNGMHVSAGGQTVGPVGVVVQPADVTTNENVYVTFNVGVTGAPPVSFQWFSNSVAIPGAVSASYRTPLTLYSTMNGAHYSVAISNTFSYAISSEAILTLIQDTAGVQVASVGSVDGRSIGVQFTSFVDPATAGNPNNYLVNGVAPTAANVRTAFANYGDPLANYPAWQKTVRLTLASQVASGYTVTVQPGVLSRTGVPVVQTNLTGDVLGLSDTDLGTSGVNPLTAGEAFSGGSNQVQLLAGGSDIVPISTTGVADYGNYAYRQRTGNFDVAAKLTWETLTANGAKAGLMVRPMPTDLSSPTIAETVFPAAPGRNTYETGMRATYGGGGTSWAASGAPANGNLGAYWSSGGSWIRIRRLGDTFAGFASSDGANWTLIGQTAPSTNDFPPLEYIGLVATAANNDGRVCEADFSNWGPVAFPNAVVSITNNLRSDYTNSENASQVFTIGATLGSTAPAGELAFQWQRAEPSAPTLFSDILVNGNTNTLRTPLLTVANDNGAKYRVICFVGDPTTGHSITSAVATLHVNLDTTPPYMVVAAADDTFSRVTITFDGPMDYSSMADPSHFTIIPSGGGTALTIFSAVPVPNPDFTYSSVVLSVDTPLSAGVRYNLCAANVLDSAGNNINNTTVPDGKCRIVTGWVLAYGYLKYERWNGPSYPGGAGPFAWGVEHLFDNPDYPYSPTTSQLITYSGYPNGDISNPSANTFDFSARISGFFIPPTTANYSWYVRGNDGTAIWVSSSSTPPVPATELHKAAVNVSFVNSSWAGSQTNVATFFVNGNSPDTSPISMTAGQPYALVALDQQANGTSFIEFTCGTDGATTLGGVSITNTPGGAYPTNGRGGAPTNTYNLKGANIATYVNPDLSVINATGPTNISVEQSRTATFNVAATAAVSAGGAPSAVPVTYQWMKNNVNITGATRNSYTTPIAEYPGDNGATFAVVMSVSGLPFMTITNSAVLTVYPDTSAPTVVSASSFGGNTIGIRYDWLMDPASVTTAANYTAVSGGLTVTRVVLRPDGQTVLLYLSGALAGSTFSVTIDNVRDLAGNPLAAGTIATGNALFAQLSAIDIGVGTNALGSYVLALNSQPALTNLTFDVNYPGSTVMASDGVFEVQASGLDIGNRQDGQQFVYEQRTGDFDLKVRVDGLTVANALSRAGLMLRENLTPGSRRYSIVADPPSTPAADGSGNGQNKVEVNYRAAQDGTSANWPNNPNPASLGSGNSATQIPGIYLRLKLVGNNLYAYTSGDALNWALAARATLASSWPKSYYVGLCATAHHTNAMAGSYTIARLSNYGDYTAPTTKQALMLVGNENNVPPGSPNAPQQASDTLAFNILLGLGYNVTVAHNLTAQPEDAEGKSVVVWSSTGNSGDVGTPLSRFAAVPVPLITWENAAPQKLNLTSAGGGTATGQTSINITNATSPLTMGLSGNVTVSTSATYTYATKASLAAGVFDVASQSSDATRTVFFACEQGATLTGANSGPSAAPHRRVVIFLDDNTPNALSTTGKQLFTNAIQWAAAASEAPSIWTQPANQTVAEGSPAVFMVTAVGPGPYTYQWTKIVGATATDIPAATNRDYTILSTGLADDASGYRVTVTGINSGLSVTSAVATLIVQTPVAIVTPPQNAQAGIGQSATFGVTVSGSAPAYQWWLLVPGVSTNAIAGAIGPSYTTPPLALADSGKQYYVVVNNLINSVTSAAATVTVSSQPAFSALSFASGQLVLDWTGGGTLQAAPEVTGEWTNVVGATSPFTNIVSPSVPRLFYRITVP